MNGRHARPPTKVQRPFLPVKNMSGKADSNTNNPEDFHLNDFDLDIYNFDLDRDIRQFGERGSDLYYYDSMAMVCVQAAPPSQRPAKRSCSSIRIRRRQSGWTLGATMQL